MKPPENVLDASIGDLPRMTGLYPRVIRVMPHENKYPLPRKRKITNTQISIQFSETSPSPMAVRVGGRTYSAECPRIYIKRPGEIHELAEQNNVLSSFYFVYAGNSGIEKLIPEDLVLFPVEITPRLHSLIDDAMALLPRIGDYEVCDRIDEICFSMLHEILLRSRGGSPRITPGERQIRRVISYLHFHAAEPVDWSRLARQFGFSERSFFRHWAACMKETPRQYLVSLRMTEARRLLAESSLAIGTIAERLGYSSLESFGFAFRKRFGMSPLAFRRRLR
ncbi:MAG: helix-turn-helix transcriptional regulator [Lentisphaeria bacterium]|nr:helix-turn-helix transcriptional regulator [Lentisphaeria bacterium]